MVTSGPASPSTLQSSPALTASQQSTASILSSQPTTPPTSQPTRCSRCGPRKGSLLELLRRHAGSSLFVRPISWLDRHAELLKISFTKLSAVTSPVPFNEPGTPPTRGHLKPTRTITELNRSLSELLETTVMDPKLLDTTARDPDYVPTRICSVLGTLWPEVFRAAKLMPEFDLFFGDKAYCNAVYAQILWNYPDPMVSSQCSFVTESTNVDGSCSPLSSSTTHNPANLPMICYTSKYQVASIRRNMFRVMQAPGSQGNEPVCRLLQLRYKALLPADPDRDVHLAGTFIAMAQKHFYPSVRLKRQSCFWNGHKELPPPKFADLTRHILTHDSRTSHFIVYTGHITAKFLGRFYYPHKAPKNDGGELDGLNIDFVRVPIWPLLGLRERLGQALSGVVGEFDHTVMETWNDEETDIPTQLKREHEVQSNASDGPSTLTYPKKRRLRRGHPLGVLG